MDTARFVEARDGPGMLAAILFTFDCSRLPEEKLRGAGAEGFSGWEDERGFSFRVIAGGVGRVGVDVVSGVVTGLATTGESSVCAAVGGAEPEVADRGERGGDIDFGATVGAVAAEIVLGETASAALDG